MRKMVQRLGKSNDPMQAWIDARKRRGLSHAEVQMARELGMNPAKLGKLDNHSPGAMEDSLRQSTSTRSDLGRNTRHCPKQ